jgi:uncharacterized membrane protein YccC
MANADYEVGQAPHRRAASGWGTALAEAARATGPPLLFGLRLWASVCLALYVAFWLELDNAYWAGTSAAIVCQPQVGASLRKGWFRMIGTLVGAVAIVILTACFPQDRALFLGGLALWGGLCAFAATVLRNFASYSAALAGYTAAIIAADTLGATGGASTNVFMLAVWRASEICIGIVCAGVVLAGTDLGGAPRRLAALFASLCAEIMSRFAASLANAAPELLDTQPVRQEFVRRIIALDPIIDQSLGESSRLRYHSPILQRAVYGLFGAMAGWRGVAAHLRRLPRDEARQETGVILQTLQKELRSPPELGDPGSGFGAAPARWMADPIGLQRIYDAAARRLIALPASTPSLRLLADETAKLLAGMAQALSGLALLVADQARTPPRRGDVRLRVADWLPALVNAARAFVTIGVVALFWIVTAWPGGAGAITFAAVTALLFAPRADQAYAMALLLTVGTLLAAIFAAIIAFAVLPGLPNQSFVAFAAVLGLYLVPSGALMAQPWLTPMFIGMTANFVPLLSPANPENYDQAQFYNQALAILAGAGAGALSFRLLPLPSPAFRTRRLLALTLRDLRGLARGRTWEGWEGHVMCRLGAMPDEAMPLQRAELTAALSVGSEILRLRQITRRLGLDGDLEPALAAVARGDGATATERLARLDAALASQAAAQPGSQTVLRARAGVLAVSEALTRHAAYFDSEPPR